MTKIVQSLADIAGDYDVLYCDLWGCLHDGRRAFPAAVEALRAFRAGGQRRVALITNAPRPAGSVKVHLDRLGVPREVWDIVVSSGDAAQHEMLKGAVGRRVWHIGAVKDEPFFADLPADTPAGPTIERVPLEDAEGIVATGLFDDLTEGPEDYRARLEVAAARDLPMLCANPDIVVDYGDQRLYCAGALAQLYEELGGRTIYVGKPHAPIYELAAERLDLGPGARILATGDGIATDAAGAANQGIDCLFVTGGLAFDQFGPDPEAPESAQLLAWLESQTQAPRYAIGRLR
ncbi:TIGR01459 family HAD-type hydrolase [Paracoccus sp. S-4012]|uniref:TIGR01459 family HAD-type hydrolase n=1 Tax=Paracoccus sp. S-4012 TaxID=2665648 RepID=UPI0012B06299|nr:TIGR01459 family HAD-type hydrolase [Paracoccus sp. S-4012]MRX51772.1 TIGR01459 family HAD-type hydrolase [Paracoccus sp. S-4012]